MKRNYLNKSKNGLKTLLAALFLFGAQLAESQCTANYSYTLGANGSVSLTSTSTGTITNTLYYWNFGNSVTPGSGLTASHTYTSNGWKTICLTITNSVVAWCSNTKCDSVLITNATSTTNPCNASFNYVLGPNGQVSFASTSTGTSVSTNYSWNFGGTASASGTSPVHTFTSNGIKTICLTITNSVTSCSSSICNTLAITNITPTNTPCNASFNYVLGANGQVNFVSNSTGTTTGTNYLWNFGGSATGSGVATNYTYTTNGTKWICLTITNSVTGCNSTYCDSVQVTNVTSTTTPCSASFNYVLGPNGQVSFASTSTGTSVSTNYSWNFGGTASGSGTSPVHTYTSNGSKWICLTITNSVTNCTSMYCDSLIISNITTSTACTPSVMFTLSKDSLMALTWNAFPFYPSNVTGATWSWGDGNTTTGLYPSHTYSAAGSYSICVTISVSCGTVTATYCYVASIFRSTESNDMILVNVKQALATGIKNVTSSGNSMSIYPNPNNGEFVLELKGFVNEQKENLVTIYNIMGQQVFEKHVMANDKQTIDVSTLTNGTYLVKVNSNGTVLHKRITIQK